MNATTLILFFIGLACLMVGAELLVRGAVRLAAGLGISSLVIGLTVVAVGTSSPEIIVSLHSALVGRPEIAVGNVVGSNILNVLLVLGIAATIRPIRVSQRVVRLDVPIMIGVSVIAFLFSLSGTIDRLEGALFLLGLIAYLLFLLYHGRPSARNGATPIEESPELRVESSRQKLHNLALVAFGLFLQVIGSRWLINGAVAIAHLAGLPELVIGLTVVAAGTSLPEIATSVLAGFRGQQDLAVGNAVGSNILNILAALGLASLVAPQGLPVSAAAAQFDMPVMMVVAFSCLPIFFTDGRISRWEGLLFLGYYAAYTVYLILGSSYHAALLLYSAIMVVFILPLTAVTLLVLTARAIHKKHRDGV